ncbi:protein C2-DOMAIN ABA-RELATED 4-like [Silene latifolia]|uniref:protein C2-DOMAIN ABA-RELATED 4-like n=1 Tax=Silene latifolia TaxID=37657 RepID=UPI003D76C1D7
MREEERMNPGGNMLGLLRLTIKRGIDLAIRDVNASDPYIIVRLANQKLKTRVIKKTLNPEWNEDLTLYVTDVNEPLKLFVYDHDTLTLDDKMGDAEVDLKPFLESVKMNLEGMADETIVTSIKPDRHNCFIEESNIVWANGKVTQNMFLRLRNVESGEIELQLQWIEVPVR